MGHVPQEPLRAQGADSQLQGRERGGTAPRGTGRSGRGLDRSRQGLGRSGEELVASWYREHGYAVVARNWRRRSGEIDIVARRGSLTVVCEVKTRTSRYFG
ncbi:MAG: YraN family protein, partial [Actinomycetota bacterium]